LILNQVIIFLFYFLKSNINQFNFIMSPVAPFFGDQGYLISL